MKIQRTSSIRRGFTLMELMVAMAITTIIVTVLVSITSIALDTWNRSRAELRASRQAKAMIDTMARDFESLVTRRGNENEWLSNLGLVSAVGGNLKSTNSSELIFYTAATDRYSGEIGKAADKGGDVSCVVYQLDWKDPMAAAGTGGSDFKTFVFSRYLIDPDKTFVELLGKKDLSSALDNSPIKANLDRHENFVCENIFQFTVTFNVQISTTTGGVTAIKNIPVSLGENGSAEEFSITGMGVKTDYSGSLATPDELAGGRVTSAEISVTVISDFGIDQLRNRNFTGSQQAEFLAKHSYEYSKLVQLPTM